MIGGHPGGILKQVNQPYRFSSPVDSYTELHLLVEPFILTIAAPGPRAGSYAFVGFWELG